MRREISSPTGASSVAASRATPSTTGTVDGSRRDIPQRMTTSHRIPATSGIAASANQPRPRRTSWCWTCPNSCASTLRTSAGRRDAQQRLVERHALGRAEARCLGVRHPGRAGVVRDDDLRMHPHRLLEAGDRASQLRVAHRMRRREQRERGGDRDGDQRDRGPGGQRPQPAGDRDQQHVADRDDQRPDRHATAARTAPTARRSADPARRPPRGGGWRRRTAAAPPDRRLR